MAKIIKIEDDRVLIGLDNGGLKEVTKDAFGYTPSVGDNVEVFENENRTIVFKKEINEKPIETTPAPSSGININVNNSVETPPQPVAAVASSSTKVVNKVAYCLLALFLGGICFHKFYAGKTGAGVCYLLFCWTFIPLILSLIDFIVGLCKHADSNGNIAI